MNIPSLNIPYTPQINGWIEHSPGNVHDRLVQYALAGLQAPPSSHSAQPPRSTNPRSTRSGSSMTPALLHQSPASPGTPPSLCSGTAATTASTASSSSISTTLIDHGLLASYPVLDDIDGVLVHPQLTTPSPLYRCIFWFLDCGYLSRNRQEWETHSRAHLRGADPPRSVTCPLCDWAASCDAGPPAAAWHAKMAHLAESHFAFGQGLSTARPDFHLFQHLWQKRLIGDEDLKALKGGNYGLGGRRPPLGNFVRTNGRGPRRERE